MHGSLLIYSPLYFLHVVSEILLSKTNQNAGIINVNFEWRIWAKVTLDGLN